MSKFDTSLSSFIRADLGDKPSQHGFRVTAVTAAFAACLSGNATQLRTAITVCTADKSLKGKAYRAAFNAVTEPARIPYKGKMSESVRLQCEAEAEALAEKWSMAFLEVCPLEKPPVNESKAAELKAKREKASKDKALQIAKDEGWIAPENAPKAYPIENLTPTALADIVASMVKAGQFDAANLRAMAGPINEALRASTVATLQTIVNGAPDIVNPDGSPIKSSKARKAGKPAPIVAATVHADRADAVSAEDMARTLALAHNAV